MKRLPAFLLVALWLVYACRQPESVVPVPAGYVAIQMGQSVVTATGLTVIADTVFPSICQKNAACIVADNVFAKLRLVRGQESQPVRLFTFFGGQPRHDVASSDSASVRLGGQLYKVILQGQCIGETEKARLGRAIVQVAPL